VQTSSVTGLAQGSIDAIIQFLVMAFILYYLLRDHRPFLEGLRGLLPLTKRESDLVLSHAGDSIHANLYATFVTSVIDSIGFGLIFWWFGLPAPVLWTLVMFFLSLLPVLGAGMVWAPTVAYLGLTGQWPPALALLAWGIFTFILVDNALYARLAGKRMRMHEVLALVAFLGGLALFGVSGVIVGPVIAAVTIGVLEVWKGRKVSAE
jgi:predicted PurR-regulated permease PerM